MIAARTRVAALLLVLVLGACAAADPPGNPPLPPGEANRGYEFIEMNGQSGRHDLVVMVSFSGGGKRSAAFAHGALRGMRQVAVPLREGGGSTLLAEMDQISAVSGGTFPAAHYILHRERSFETFGTEFLDRDIESYIWGTFLLPWNWSWLFSASYGTNDRMAEIYDRLMFRGATYGDLIRLGRPRLAIAATELSSGATFAFLPFPFDLICADLARYPVARAVAASNGFPVLFTPVTLENHRRPGCTSPLPPFPEPEALRRDVRQQRLNDMMQLFADADRARYVHLMDGGISDNLALRYVLLLIGGGGERGANYAERVRPVRRVVMLVVDGQASNDPELVHQRVVYGLGTVLNAVSGGQIDNYNLETMALAQVEIDRLVRRNIDLRCAAARVIEGRPCDDVQGLVVRVALADHPDPDQRARLQAIRTGLTIPAEDVALLVRSGEDLVRDSARLRDFLGAIDAPPRSARRRQ
jgi:NTE family protein